MKTIILTLNRYPYRRHTMEGALKALGYPMEKVTFWYGPDALHAGHPPLTANIALAAIADGFPVFKHLLLRKNSQHHFRKRCNANIHITAQHWSFCQIYRYITEQKNTYLVCHDDILPRYTYQELCQLVEALKAAGNFKLLHYQWFKRKDIDLGQTQPSHISHINKGLSGHGDKINIVSPEGAAWMLELLKEFIRVEKTTSAEDIFRLDANLYIPEGVYSIEKNDEGTGMNWGKYVLQLHDPKQDSNIMFYRTDQQFRFKVPIQKTNTIPDIDWHYYDNVLLKLKEHYVLLNNTL